MTDRFHDCLYGFTWLPGDDGQPYHVTPNDKGGPTAWGVTLTTYAAWQHDHGILTTTAVDLKNATQEQLAELLRARYWAPVSGDLLPIGLDLMVFDFGTLRGVGTSARVLQRTVNVEADGYIGPVTLQAIAKIGSSDLLTLLSTAQLANLKALDDFALFGNGWTNRQNARLAMARKMAGIGVPVPTLPAPEPVYETEVAAALRHNEVRELLERLISMSVDFKTELDTLKADVAAQTTVTNSALTFISGMSKQLADVTAALAAAGVTPEQMSALTDLDSAVKANTSALAAAIPQNTAASSEPAPASAPAPGSSAPTPVTAAPVSDPAPVV